MIKVALMLKFSGFEYDSWVYGAENPNTKTKKDLILFHFLQLNSVKYYCLNFPYFVPCASNQYVWIFSLSIPQTGKKKKNI